MTRFSKNFRLLLVGMLVMVMNLNTVYGGSIEKGNPVASYYGDVIMLEDGTSIEIEPDYKALFLNGTLVTEYEVIMRNNRAMVPIRLVSEELGGTIDWDEQDKTITIEKGEAMLSLTIDEEVATVNGQSVTLDCPVILREGRTYVPLRFVSENLDAAVTYAPAAGDEWTYYYDTNWGLTPGGTMIRDYPNIFIDEKYDAGSAISKDEAMAKAQETCKIGLENFKKSMVKNLKNAGEPVDRFDNDFRFIEKEIDRMLYLGEMSRYYQFTIGVYDVLLDKYNGNMYFVNYSSGIIVRKVDVHDPGLYIPSFIVG